MARRAGPALPCSPRRTPDDPQMNEFARVRPQNVLRDTFLATSHHFVTFCDIRKFSKIFDLGGARTCGPPPSLVPRTRPGNLTEAPLKTKNRFYSTTKMFVGKRRHIVDAEFDALSIPQGFRKSYRQKIQSLNFSRNLRTRTTRTTRKPDLADPTRTTKKQS